MWSRVEDLSVYMITGLFVQQVFHDDSLRNQNLKMCIKLLI